MLHNVQAFASSSGFYVSRMMPRLHSYHLDDNPELRSCNLIIQSAPGNNARGASEAIVDEDRLRHFYGLDQAPRVRYIRERKRLDYGMAHPDDYEFELLPEVE